MVAARTEPGHAGGAQEGAWYFRSLAADREDRRRGQSWNNDRMPPPGAAVPAYSAVAWPGDRHSALFRSRNPAADCSHRRDGVETLVKARGVSPGIPWRRPASRTSKSKSATSSIPKRASITSDSKALWSFLAGLPISSADCRAEHQPTAHGPPRRPPPGAGSVVRSRPDGVPAPPAVPRRGRDATPGSWHRGSRLYGFTALDRKIVLLQRYSCSSSPPSCAPSRLHALTVVG